MEEEWLCLAKPGELVGNLYCNLTQQIIELPLRVQVIVAQTQAGMWRRNGYALLNQVGRKSLSINFLNTLP